MMDNQITVLLTDTHFGTHNNSMTWLRSQKDFFYNQFIPYLEELKKANKQVRLVHTGDVFDSRSSINTHTANVVIQIFERLCQIVERIDIVLGNHDYFSPADDSVNTVDIVFGRLRQQYSDTLHIYSKETGMVQWGKETSLYLPWYEWLSLETDRPALLSLIRDNHITRIYTHADLQFGSYTDIPCDIVSGHIHTPFFVNNVKNLGSCFALTFTDANSQRGFYTIENGEFVFHENTQSLRFWRIYGKDILKIPEEIKPSDYVELYANKSTLARKNYTDACNRWFDRFKNIMIIPQPDENKDGSMVDIRQFEGYDVERMTESLIPEELKEKFEKVKEYLESNKDL